MSTKSEEASSRWAEILEDSEAELAAGLTVSGETVHRELAEVLARLEAKFAERDIEAAGRG
jgi:hypothetical protein